MLHNKDIKNVVFDLGGVLLDIDFSRSLEALKAIGCPSVSEVSTSSTFAQLFLDFEQGQIQESDFYNRMRQELQMNISDATLEEVWNKTLIGTVESKMKTLKELSNHYFVYLLSNTNSIHWRWIIDYYQQQYKCDFITLFQKVYLSHEVKLSKPSESIFKLVIQDAQLQPSETLFIDDKEENTAVADKLGFNTFTPQSNGEWASIFRL